MSSPSEPQSFPDDSRYVLRLVVVKVEGVLVESFQETVIDRLTSASGDGFDTDSLFPDWYAQLGVSEETLRDTLEQLAGSAELQLDENIIQFLDDLHNHTPLRVALLSSGPSEWVKTLAEHRNLDAVSDLIYSYDRYPHGTRRTLLQFLMNRFIAGKGRTLFLGNSMMDQRVADREDARFRSLESPPDTSESPERWNWSLEELRDYVREIQAED